MPNRHRMARVCRGVLSGAVIISVMLLPAAAAAHPFGDPLTARVSADGSVVTIRWSAPSDDLVMLGGAVGALPARQEVVFETGPDGDPEPVSASAAEVITSSPAVTDYLRANLAVRQNDVPCPSEVSIGELLEGGALMTFTCPEHVQEVDIEITALTDLHEAYRTVAVGDGASRPDEVLYTSGDSIATWSFQSGGPTSNSQGSGSKAWWVIAAGSVLLITSVALVGAFSRRCKYGGRNG